MIPSPTLPFWIDQKYEAVRLLGKGGGGQAFLAKKGGQTVAMKLLDLGWAKEPERAIQKFKKEFLTLKKLNHPHIGRLYDFGYDSKIQQYYFVGEWIKGDDIRKTCGSLSVEEIEKLFVQALQALHYLHTYSRAGLRHNDIKAANILVNKTDKGHQLKLIDFGLASLAPLEVKGGTASYMSPEQIALTFPDMAHGEIYPKPDHRTDLYSLGVLWYLCLTGKNPFLVERDSTATLKKHFDALPPPPSHYQKEISSYLDKIILRLLQKYPKDRYDSASEVICDLAFLSHKPYSVIPGNQRKYYLPEGELIGNAEAWKTLKTKWEGLSETETPSPEIVWILGERGLGKTKFLEHFKNWVQADDGKFLFLKNETTEAVEEWIAEISRLFSNPQQPAIVAVDDFLEQHAAYRPLLEIWQKMRHLKKWNPTQTPRWLFVFTAEKAEETTKDFGRESSLIWLKPLNEAELQEWVRKISPHKNGEIPESFLTQLKNHTDGNPLFVSSILKSLAQNGLLWDDAGAWHPVLFQRVGIDFKKLPIPNAVQFSLKKEWGKLKKNEKGFLSWLSCFENGVFVEKGILPSLLSRGILIQDPKGKILFKNSFLQRSIYERIPPAKKAKYHDAIAQHLQKQKASPQNVACHLARGSKIKSKILGLQQLAPFYEQKGNVEEASQAYQHLTKLFAKKDFKNRLSVVMHWIKMLNRNRNSTKALQLCDRWLPKIPKMEKGWQAAFLREKGIALLNQQKWDLARECLEKALQIIGAHKKRLKEQLLLKNTIAATWLHERQLKKAIAIYSETRKRAASLSNDEKLEVLNNDLGHAYLLNQESTKALRCFEEDLKWFEAADDKTRLLRCHFLMGNLFRRQLRDFNAAVKHYQTAAELAKDTKDNDWLMRVYNGLAGAYLDRSLKGKAQNDLAQALRFFEESLALCRYVKRDQRLLDFETAAILLNIGTVQSEMGNFTKAADTFQTILKIFESKPDKTVQEFGRLSETYIALAECRLHEKNYLGMEEPLKKAWPIAKNTRELLEHRLAIQLLWAEVAHFKKDTNVLRGHLDYIDQLQTKYKVNPTPMAKKRIEELKTDIPLFMVF